jgi:hypothetical protein
MILSNQAWPQIVEEICSQCCAIRNKRPFGIENRTFKTRFFKLGKACGKVHLEFNFMTKIEKPSFPFSCLYIVPRPACTCSRGWFFEASIFLFPTFSQYCSAIVALYLACAFDQSQPPPLLFGLTWPTWRLYQARQNLHLQPKHRTAQKPAGIAGGVAVAHVPFLIVEQILRCRRERSLAVDYLGAN